MTDYWVVNQARLAELFGCDRTSIRRFHREGMPYKAGDPGGEHKYVVPLCWHWYLAREALQSQRFPFAVTPLFMILFSYTALAAPDVTGWKREALSLAKAGGFSRDAALETLGLIRGAGLLDQ